MSRKISTKLLAGTGVAFTAAVVMTVAATRRDAPKNASLGLHILNATTPVPTGSKLPNILPGYGGEELALSWVESGEGGDPARLRFSIFSKKGKWSDPKTVVTSAKFNPHPSVLPAVAMLGDGALVAEWTQLTNSDPGQHVYAAASGNLGSSWTAPVRVNRDDTESEHSLVSITAGQKRADLVWLDGRESSKSGDYALMNAGVDATGTVSPETVLDARVCSCCPTAITNTPSGLVVAYRDRTQDEIRDISVLRFANSMWSKPAVLHHDGWRINGCPNNGAALDSRQDALVAAWYTAANGKPHVELAFSTNGGSGFHEPIIVDDGNPAGRAAIALISSDDAIVTWVERKSDAARLLARRVSIGGRLGAAIEIASGGVRDLGFPRIATAGREALITWTSSGEAPRVNVAWLKTGADGK